MRERGSSSPRGDAAEIAVYGLGYVGAVTAACLAQRGHRVLGVDVHAGKVDTINRGASPIVEPGLDALTADAVRDGRLRASTDASEAAGCGVTILCVGTPSLPSGGQDLSALLRVLGTVGRLYRDHPGRPLVIVRSTVLPGTFEAHLRPALEAASGRSVGEGIGLAVAPEFLREGSGVDDFFHAPLTLVGAIDARSGEQAAALLAVEGAEVRCVAPDAAVMVKYASNAFHALKVAFANEVDEVCGRFGVDGREVMELFCLDDKLNVSSRYLRPGFAFGGSCLPKDLRGLLHAARHSDARLPVLESVLPSNALRVQHAVDRVVQSGRRRVAVVGLSFKPGTDDLRESPLVAFVETLLGKGFALTVYDPSLSIPRLTGSNQAFIAQAIPHLELLLAPSIERALEGAEVVVLGHAGAHETVRGKLVEGQLVVDIARTGE